MQNDQETYDSLVLVHGLPNVTRYYRLWEEKELSNLQSKCDGCGTLGTEAVSIAYPKRLCTTCGLAEQARVFKSRQVVHLPAPHTTDGHYAI